MKYNVSANLCFKTILTHTHVMEARSLEILMVWGRGYKKKPFKGKQEAKLEFPEGWEAVILNTLMGRGAGLWEF